MMMSGFAMLCVQLVMAVQSLQTTLVRVVICIHPIDVVLILNIPPFPCRGRRQ